MTPARPGPLVTAAAALAVAVQLYGVYRPSGPPAPPWLPGADKVEHLVGFALPTLLVLLALPSSGGRGGATSRRTFGVVALFALHGVVSELIQHQFYRYRTGDPLDALADTAGVAAGWAGYAWWSDRRRPRTRGAP